MGIVVTCVNQKGGVGKSTTVSALAYSLTNLPSRVLLINLDPQRNLDMFAGKNVAIPRGDLETKNMLHVMQEKCSLKDIIVHTEIGDLARASNQLSNWTGQPLLERKEFNDLKSKPDVLVDLLEQRFQEQGRQQRILQNALLEVRDAYDWILIDSNPSLQLCTLNGIVASDYALIPAFCEESSKAAIEELWETIQGIKYFDPSKYLEIAGILVTNYFPLQILSRRYVKQFLRMAELMNTIVFPSRIRHSVSASECMEQHQNIMKYDSDGTTSKDYTQFAKEFVKRIQELEEKRYG